MSSFRSAIRYTIIILFAFGGIAKAQKDTLRVMGYNVLYYGNGCQGPTQRFHKYLQTIVAYTNPDILSLEKMASIPVTRDDKYGTAPYGFADSVVRFALDPAFPGRYAHTPFTNDAHTTNMAVIFYDRNKLGFLSIVSSYVNVTDFNTYKFYYRDPALSRTHDTTFLYVIPNHDMSGDDNEGVRGKQMEGVMRTLKTHFAHLPNMIDLGDFNVRNSDEPFYKVLTTDSDSGFRFSDPPFFPDQKLSYFADWNHDPKYAAYFTTSTRESASIPNACGTGGGAKNWYDHIFLSPWIINNANYIRYIPNSYRTIGNDCQRFKISVNNSNSHTNTSAPAEVIEALYQMSNKYPVMADLEVTSNTSGRSMADPEIAGVQETPKETVTVSAIAEEALMIHFPADMTGQQITIQLFDTDGKEVMNKTKSVKGPEMAVKCKVAPGTYKVKLTGHHNILVETKITKK